MDLETEAKRLGQEVLAAIIAEAGEAWNKLKAEDLAAAQRAGLFAGRIIALQAAGQTVSRTEHATYLAALGTLESIKVAGLINARMLVIAASMNVLDKVLQTIGSVTRKLLLGLS